MAMRRLMVTVSHKRFGATDDLAEESGQPPVSLPEAELELREAELGYDEGVVVLKLGVEVLGPERGGDGSLTCRTNLERVKSFVAGTEKTLSAGRPICPLCGGPIDAKGHDCPSRN